MKDYYQILQLEPTASDDEVKKSYRQLARLYHPDYNNSDSARYMFQEIHEAYQTLSDKEARTDYDRRFNRQTSSRLKSYYEAQKEAEKRQQTNPGPDFQRTQQKQSRPKAAGPYSKRQSEDLQKKLFGTLREKSDNFFDEDPVERTWNGGLGSQLRSQFKHIKLPEFLKSKSKGAAKTNPQRKRQRADVEDEIKGEREYLFTITARESVSGTSRDLALRDIGTGPRLLRVKVPPGISDQAILKVPIDDDTDARIRVKIVNDSLLERNGFDLTLKLPITIGEAITGANIEIPTPQGPTTVRIPPQKNEEKKLRLKGRGILDQKTGLHGDFYVRPYIVPPEHRSETAEHAAKALDEHYSKPVRMDIPKKL